MKAISHSDRHTCICCGMIWSGEEDTCPRCGQAVPKETEQEKEAGAI